MASLKVDNRGSFGSKRSRNDDSRGDGDWTCPECGNVNFGFRNICNRANCAFPRPPAFPTHDPMTSQYSNASPFHFGGFGGPPIPYGSSSRYGSPVPPSMMHYNYAVPPGPPGLYAHAPPYTPAGFGGMGYASPTPMNGYGFGFQGYPWLGEMTPENPASRKRRGGPDSSYDGDWKCPKCDNVNFAFRTVCNIKKCGAARPFNGLNQSSYGAPGGSWTCCNCGNLNYAFRTVCNRKECGTEKPNF